MKKNLSADLERNRGQGTRDKEKWEGEAPAEPKRRRMASSEWRIVLDGKVLVLPKKFRCLTIALRTLHLALKLGLTERFALPDAECDGSDGACPRRFLATVAHKGRRYKGFSLS